MADVTTIHLSKAEMAALRRDPHSCEVTIDFLPCEHVAVAVAATVSPGGVEVFPVCARHIKPGWAHESWRLVPLADLIGGER